MIRWVKGILQSILTDHWKLSLITALFLLVNAVSVASMLIKTVDFALIMITLLAKLYSISSQVVKLIDIPD